MDGDSRQNPAYRATLLFICFVTHAAERDMRKNLVEVFARVRVNLQLLKVKIDFKRAGWRTVKASNSVSFVSANFYFEVMPIAVRREGGFTREMGNMSASPPKTGELWISRSLDCPRAEKSGF